MASMARSSLSAGGARSAAIAAAARRRREIARTMRAVERALAREVVVDHRLVDRGAAGDAIDAGAGEAARGELARGGGEDARSGVRGRGGGRAIKLG